MIHVYPGYLEGLVDSIGEHGGPMTHLIDEVEGWEGLGLRDMALLDSLGLS